LQSLQTDAESAMGFANTITLSSVGTSRPVLLDWMNGTPVAVLVLGASAAVSTSIQYSLDDIMQTASSLVTWVTDPNYSGATSNTSVAFTYTQPLAAIRLNSSTNSTPGTLTLKVTQGSFL
jgi:multisubunit Na+/H+ antiporter MnhE subunit